MWNYLLENLAYIKTSRNKIVRKNSFLKTFGFCVVGGALGVILAPVIATTAGALGLLGATATTGVAISSLSGIALTNASLAAIGGGAISVGGAGIAGGTAIITTASGLTAASISVITD